MNHDDDWIEAMARQQDAMQQGGQRPPERGEVVVRSDGAAAFRPQGEVVAILATKEKGGEDVIVKTTFNLQMILENDSRWQDRLVYDEWTEEPLIWDCGRWRVISDADIEGLRQWVSACYGLEYSFDDVNRCVAVACDKARMNELRAWLEGLIWDGEARLDRLWSGYFACEPSWIAGVFGVKWAVQAVARALDPGCEAHAMVVIQGAQGRGKTRGVHALAGTTPRGTKLSGDLPADKAVGDRDSLMAMRALWIVNADELSALNRSSIDGVKAWITATCDTYRSPYERRPQPHTRHSVLIGSTNMVTFLHDSTGSRRFWVVSVEGDRKVDVDAIGRDREQIWAEAVHRYRAGEQWWLTDEQEAERTAASARWEDEGWRVEEIDAYTVGRDRVVVAWVLRALAEAQPVGDEGRARGRITAHLQRDGWVRSAKKAKIVSDRGVPSSVFYWSKPGETT